MMSDKRQIGKEDIKKALLSKRNYLEEVLAIGIFGSLARGDFGERSDIDVFVVIKDEDDRGEETDIKWYFRVKELLKNFRRDVTVLVYTPDSLKAVPTWHTLRMAKEGLCFYDKGGIKNIFDAIVAEAKKVGLVEKRFGRKKVWTMNRLLEPGEIIEVRLEK
ncbi:MAG: nucleotidyltransferase domain-containing protein [bacterium]